jgi:hypothetical protein
MPPFASILHWTSSLKWFDFARIWRLTRIVSIGHLFTWLQVPSWSKASASLLKLLAHACPAACDVQDEEGKTPLHFACDSSCVLFEEDHHDDGDDDDTSKQPPNHESVAALLSYSIHAATLEDDEEMSPLEHAIMSGASLETVKLLQSATSKGMRMQVVLHYSNEMLTVMGAGWFRSQ